MAFRKGDLIHFCVLVWVFRLFVDVCYIFFFSNVNQFKLFEGSSVFVCADTDLL